MQTSHPDQRRYERRRTRPLPIRSQTVTGQCDRCLDLFSVDLYCIGTTLGVSETPRIHWYPHRAGTDRPEIEHHCGGGIRLYGSTISLFAQSQSETGSIASLLDG